MTRSAAVMAVVAWACVRPTTSGTVALSGPLDMTRSTAEPSVTTVPAVGDWLMTFLPVPSHRSAASRCHMTRLAAVMADVAWACVRPTTSGTVVSFDRTP